MEPFKTCITQERGEGSLTKKVTKSDLGGGLIAKKSDTTHLKNEILRVTCFLNNLYDADLFCFFFMSIFVDVISFL